MFRLIASGGTDSPLEAAISPMEAAQGAKVVPWATVAVEKGSFKVSKELYARSTRDYLYNGSKRSGGRAEVARRKRKECKRDGERDGRYRIGKRDTVVGRLGQGCWQGEPGL